MDAYTRFVHGHAQIRRLIEAVDAWPAGGQLQVDALRGVAVLLCAEFEACLRETIQDRLDKIADDWSKLTLAERRLVANRIVAAMALIAEDLYGRDTDAKSADRVAREATRHYEWLTVAGQFAAEAGDHRLGSFHDPESVARTVEANLAHLRTDGTRFFDWLGSVGANQTSMKQQLRGLVQLRNDAAHQTRLNLQPTPYEIRGYMKLTAGIVRAMRRYLADAPMGPAVGALPAGALPAGAPVTPAVATPTNPPGPSSS